MAIIVALDGVLRDQHGEAIHAGVKLFSALSESYRIILSTDSTLAEADRWTKLNGCTNHGGIMDSSLSWPDKTVRERHIEVAREHGNRLELIVDSQAEVALLGAKLGIPVLLFAVPKSARPEFAIRTWGEITDEIAKQKLMAAGVESHVEAYE